MNNVNDKSINFQSVPFYYKIFTIFKDELVDLHLRVKTIINFHINNFKNS